MYLLDMEGVKEKAELHELNGLLEMMVVKNAVLWVTRCSQA